MGSADWRELKQVVEHSFLQGNPIAERLVLEQWIKKGPQKAIGCLVGRVVDPKNRVSWIAQVVRDWK